MQRLNDLAQLRDGWLDGQGKAVSSEAQSAMRKMLARNGSLASERDLFPTEEGGLVLEFKRAGWDFSVEALPAGDLQIYGIKIGHPDQLEPTAVPDPSRVALAIEATIATV